MVSTMGGLGGMVWEEEEGGPGEGQGARGRRGGARRGRALARTTESS